MSELFDEDIVDESNESTSEKLSYDTQSSKDKNHTEVRRKLEELLEEKRLRKELEDFLE